MLDAGGDGEDTSAGVVGAGSVCGGGSSAGVKSAAPGFVSPVLACGVAAGTAGRASDGAAPDWEGAAGVRSAGFPESTSGDFRTCEGLPVEAAAWVRQ